MGGCAAHGRRQLVHRGHRDGPDHPRPAPGRAGAHPDAHLLRCRPGDCPRRPAAGPGGRGRGDAHRVRGGRGQGGQERRRGHGDPAHGGLSGRRRGARGGGGPAGRERRGRRRARPGRHGRRTAGGQLLPGRVLQLLRHEEPADRRRRRDHHDRRRPGRALAADAAARDERRFLAALPPVGQLAVHGRRRRDEGEPDRSAGGDRPRTAASPAGLAAAPGGHRRTL